MAEGQSCSTLLSFLKSIPKTNRVSPAIQHCCNGYQITIKLVVDCVGKTLGKRSVKATIWFGVDAGIKNERVNVGEKAVEKIGADTLCLSFVKSVTIV